MRRFVDNLVAVLLVLLLVALSLAAVVGVIAFAATVFQHHDWGGPYYIGDKRPDVNWLYLAGSALSTLLAVGVWTLMTSGDDGYYCPNCKCPDCVEERQRRKEAAELATIAAASSAAASSAAASGSIFNSN